MASPDTETPGPVSVARRLRRKKIAAVLIVVAVIAGGLFTWDLVLRPRTIREVLEAGPYRPGTEVRVAGTITGVFQWESSQGPIVALDLDDPSFLSFLSQGARDCAGGMVRGDPSTSYNIGDRFETVLRFESYRLNGDPAVWAPELLCPYPAVFRSIGIVLDAVSEAAGIMLTYNGTDAGGWSRYDIWARNSSSPDALPADLLKAPPTGNPIDSAARWRGAASRFNDMVSAAVGSDAHGLQIVDRMTSLGAGTSANGTLRFVDADANGLVNTGDRLEARLPSAGPPNDWAAYLLRVAGPSVAGPLHGFHMILHRPEGPLEMRADPQASPQLETAPRNP